MLELKKETVERVSKKILKLPENKKMFVLGIIQGKMLDEESLENEEPKTA